ncbi:nuclear transport factor 2 family protein [uncultured Mycobacterium sp.]|uniref:nuclear transport factor 2 family protein n=1 Tax=uncultured Mycobacterium sp. TaxID=171292 RepID=UPI0035CB6F3C
MGQWSRDEIERAFHDYSQAVVEIGRSADWSRYADLFTDDAVYLEHVYGEMHGRERIREWIASTMSEFPGSEMPFYPAEWYTIDEDRGWVIGKILNRMKDPGDGSIHQAPTLTVLHYAGNGLWSYEEDAYNPLNFLAMVHEYTKRCQALGTISEEALAFAKNMNWQLD